MSCFDRPAASAGGSSIGVVVVCWFVFFVPLAERGGTLLFPLGARGRLCQSADQLD